VAPGGKTPRTIGDFRRILDDQSVDVLVIAAPDHWHATATILALQAGKHVYGEKPGSHNAREGELVAEAQQRHGRTVQMGNQQRSGPRSMQIVHEIHEGLIGRPYLGRAWYANTRGSIGHGKPAAVPDWLDYELWQGPAPRTPYRDNVVPYNWHWFWRWGTGEICNNATHEIDVCRWALQVDFPTRVTSAGGRFHFDDDWEMYDTQNASYEFDNGTTITWDGRSCNGQPVEGRSRGASIHGETGTVILDREGYEVYDNDHRLLRRDILQGGGSSLDTRGGGRLTDRAMSTLHPSRRANWNRPGRDHRHGRRSPARHAHEGLADMNVRDSQCIVGQGKMPVPGMKESFAFRRGVLAGMTVKALGFGLWALGFGLRALGSRPSRAAQNESEERRACIASSPSSQFSRFSPPAPSQCRSRRRRRQACSRR
jgi:predicted dehydrogenase